MQAFIRATTEEMRMTDPTIQVLKTDSWCEITLNRPEKLNSFNEDMHLALRKAITDAQAGGARALLLTGAGRAFCAGQDLGDRGPSKMTAPPDLGHTVRTFYAPLVNQIRSLPVPVVCAVNGVAAGAGASLALACDIVLAGKSARFIQSFSKVGLIPDTGGSWHLPKLLGEARAKGLALTALPISAERAADWGLIWDCVDDADLMDDARALTAQLAAGPTLGLGLTKAAIQTAATNSLAEQLELEATYMKICGESADYAEGVSAFLQKRKAEFQGK